MKGVLTIRAAPGFVKLTSDRRRSGLYSPRVRGYNGVPFCGARPLAGAEVAELADA